jgi:hypothetical protein
VRERDRKIVRCEHIRTPSGVKVSLVKTECDDVYCFHLPFNQSLSCLEKLKAAAQNKEVTAVDETGNPSLKKLRLVVDSSTVAYY